MDLNLDDKVVLVTGASRGIGLGIASAFYDEGARVVLNARNADTLSKAAACISSETDDRLFAVPADMTDAKEAEACVQSVVEHWGRIDILVANVGTGRSEPGWSASSDAWQAALDTNLMSSVQGVRAVIPSMQENGSGSIVLIASITGIETTLAPLTYSAAKAGLINYGKNLARQIAPLGIRVNTIAPGNIFFEEGTWDKKLKEDDESVKKYLAAEVPMNRFGSPEEVANVVLFLSSERASFVTGSCVLVDGGQTRKTH